MPQVSPKQKALFFALAHDLGYDAPTVKQRAKQHFGLASFNDITTQQRSELIDRLLAVQARRGQEAATDPAACGESRSSDGPGDGTAPL
jgi:hypothetical protein